MWPQSLRGRLLLLMVLSVALPIVASGYLVTLNAEKSLVAEKQQKLFGAARVLEQHLTGDYNAILAREGAEHAGRDRKIAVLSRALTPSTDAVAAAYPGIGVGYYSKALDAIITYGPSEIFGDKVGLPISESHEGRMVMATGTPRVQEGELVRGDIMNAMVPVSRAGVVIGYIWANELTSDIQAQVGAMKRQIYLTMLLSLCLGVFGVAYLVDRFLVAHVERIKDGVDRLRSDLSVRLPALPGEVGEIADVINDMAGELAAKKRLEQQVQRAERLALVGEVAAGLAHEIRNPLMAIKGFAQLLNEDGTAAEHEEYTGIIVREADRMNRLIEELLCFARPAASRVMPMDVNAVLESTLLLIETRTMRSHILLERRLAADLPRVPVDGEQLKQVILNIVINAVQALESKGKIILATGFDAVSREVTVSVTDNGPGIAPENVARLFDPFFTTKEAGTGLGLSVALRLMENWGGKILVDSTVGQGSTFTLVLPLPEGSEDDH